MRTRLRQLWAHETVRAASWLCVILILTFLPCALGTRTFMAGARDAASIVPDGAWAGPHKGSPFPKTLDEGVPGYLTEPWFRLVGQEYSKEHNAPLWNPYQAFGMPLAANMESQPFYPFTALLSLRLTPWTYNVYILARLYLAGLFLYLYLRLFISYRPALAGGIACLLGGYYILFLTMQQTSVEVLAPAALFTAEQLIRKSTYWRFCSFAGVSCLVLLGGMPESSFVLLLFVYAYLVWRIATDTGLRKRWTRTSLVAGVATLAGFSLSAFLLLPFFEFLQLSFDLHQPENLGGVIAGLQHDTFNSSISTYLLPLLNGPPNNTLFVGLRNYLGLIQVYLAAVALFACLGREKWRNALCKPSIFFSAAIVLVILKRYGFPLVNEIGGLPMFRLIAFPKYDELIVTVSGSILAGFGLQRINDKSISAFSQAMLFWTLAAAVLACKAAPSVVGSGNNFGRIPFPIRTWPFVLAICILVGLALVLSASGRGPYSDSSRNPVVARLLVLLTAEAFLAYIFPAYYLYNKLPRSESNPYLGAPYIQVLANHSRNDGRIFLRDGVLFPNWASAFQLQDVRAVGAMYYRKYFDFLHAFFPGPYNSPDGELANRFNGAGPYQFADPLSVRFLQLTSTELVGGIRAYTKPNRRVEDVLSQNAGHLQPGKEANIQLKQFQLDGEAREGLGEHPPYQRLPYSLDVPATGTPIFQFAIALDPGVYNVDAGDGVGFTLEVRDASGTIHPAYSHYLDPHHNLQDRHWQKGSIELSPFRGQRVQLLFTTDPGPKGDVAYDWATWSDFRMPGDTQPAMVQPFRAIYSGEVNLYQNPKVLPRASIYDRAEIADIGTEALKKLTANDFDPFETAVVDSQSLNSSERTQLRDMNAKALEPVRPAVIESYSSRHVSIKSDESRSSLLILNDSDYPGWTVKLDGRPAHWFTANYMFRGVLLPAGLHHVQFDYNPRSFLAGSLVSGCTLLLLAAVGWRNRSRPVAI